MGTRVQSVKGMRDLLPPETAVWSAVEDTARRVFGSYGYLEIRTPLVEPTELFVRGVGAGTDIVGKEMYSFEDRKGRSLSLRPESTASVARAFIEHRLADQGLPARLYYLGPQFRYERPQRGRYRQFHQIGAELIGDPGPLSDVEILLMLVRFLEALGFRDLVVLLNTVGDEESRSAYRTALVDYLEPYRERLGADSRRRLRLNPLRILDTKDPDEKRLLEDAPRLEAHLSAASREHFAVVGGLLRELGIEFEIEPRLVRGLDYYTRTVFEIVSRDLGAQDAIVGGGRYDRLIEELGGPATEAIGFAIGEDRLIEVLPAEFGRSAAAPASALVVPVGEAAGTEALRVAEELRRRGLSASIELSGRSLKAALKQADRRGHRFAVLVGEDEIAAGTVTLRDLREGIQRSLPREALAEALEERA